MITVGSLMANEQLELYYISGSVVKRPALR